MKVAIVVTSLRRNEVGFNFYYKRQFFSRTKKLYLLLNVKIFAFVHFAVRLHALKTMYKNKEQEKAGRLQQLLAAFPTFLTCHFVATGPKFFCKQKNCAALASRCSVSRRSPPNFKYKKQSNLYRLPSVARFAALPALPAARCRTWQTLNPLI